MDLKEKGIDFENTEEGSINYLLLLYDNSKLKFEEYVKYAENKEKELQKELNEIDWDNEILDEITDGEYGKLKEKCEKLKSELSDDEKNLNKIKSSFLNFKKKKENQQAYDEKKKELEKLNKIREQLEKEKKKTILKIKSLIKHQKEMNKYKNLDLLDLMEK
ncbi:hypothetical protein [Leptotrichia sp. oral taxon 847]|uniref:hypothetical protein n=1 Tax=Leptotrichia sp. oral taxon 847 TaxID=1785996 RepID=UPI0007683022|nr:hypothetical protein [Leptotrichia sp. oral taxon 847]AMD95917.1 hypothetical protein AXF11_10235 [Leptotrichia sp. oral taxon 847]